PRGDRLHIRLCLLRRHAGLETPNRLIYSQAARLEIEVTIAQPPQVSLKRKTKVRWHHADHSQAAAIDAKLAADDRWIAAETPLPQVVTEQNGVGLFLSWTIADEGGDLNSRNKTCVTDM